MAGQTSIDNGRKGGRPVGVRSALTEKANKYIAKRVTKELKPIIDKAIEQAKQGDTTTRKDLFDRAYGRPKEQVEHSGSVKSIIEVVRDLESENKNG